jgi:hypothetical protein
MATERRDEEGGGGGDKTRGLHFTRPKTFIWRGLEALRSQDHETAGIKHLVSAPFTATITCTGRVTSYMGYKSITVILKWGLTYAGKRCEDHVAITYSRGSDGLSQK